MGSDFNERYQIGTAPVERPAKAGPISYSRINFWYPNKRPSDNGKAYKQTMIGTTTGAERYSNDIVFPDYDIDFYIRPDSLYNYLIRENPRPNSNYKSANGDVSGGDLPNCPNSFTDVEAEIDLKDISWQFTEHFKYGIGNNGKAGFYGAWIHDAGHCDRPEIHPAEQISWRKKSM